MDRVLFLSSDFTRAYQTAEECIKAIKNVYTYELSDMRSDAPRLSLSSEKSPDAESTVQTIHPSSDVLSHVLSLKVGIHRELRERFFGRLDGTVLVNYNQVWPVDSIDAQNTRQGVESVSAVISRVSRLIKKLESIHENKIFILTSHADTLQITQTYLAGEDPRKFSQYRFKNGEVRDMEVLPPPVPLTFQ
eukprot:CAMPEP_0182420418 /NCGR_PEP_ID=MMETSP1167-20130531/5211_1 /TAXON_ID=2988 /ORGANISM="Mallomonas Sp, Strain CCMP3275" /LENGTH=190 /DNA_ID=CAMNT_0024596343 /DNA_START=410 /DNA_END=982 /DNA_ORIENTATION=+